MPNLNIFFCKFSHRVVPDYKWIIKDYKDYKRGKPLLRGVKTIMHKKTLKKRKAFKKVL